MCACGECPSCRRLGVTGRNPFTEPASNYNPGDWKPGDVAMVTFASAMRGEERIALRNGIPGNPGWAHGNGASQAWTADSHPAGPIAARRLLVIDPEDRETAKRLGELYGSSTVGGRTSSMQDALRRMLQPPEPPKPDEPLGLGAVVRDASGGHWVRSGRSAQTPNGEKFWWHSDHGSATPHWHAIDAVEVLSEGVR